jgi:hypothetical protein
MKTKQKPKQKPGTALQANLEQQNLLMEFDKYNNYPLTKKSNDVCKILNMLMDNVSEEMIDKYCVMNNIGCGDVSTAVFDISDTGCLMNGDYNDPVECSYIMYMLAAKKFNDRLKTMKSAPKRIERFEVATRGNEGLKAYQFCLKAYYNDDKDDEDNKFILLGGDWIFKWGVLAKTLAGESQEEKRKLVLETNTLKDHVFWPCQKQDNINQARKNVSFTGALTTLERCMDNKFDLEKAGFCDNEFIGDNYKNFIMTICMYKDWFMLFENYRKYINFWDISENPPIDKLSSEF